MLLAKIVGTVVATRKDPRLVSSKLLVVRPMDPRGKAEGGYLVAVDTVDAGVGRDGARRQRQLGAHGVAASRTVPVDAAIVGVIDEIEMNE